MPSLPFHLLGPCGSWVRRSLIRVPRLPATPAARPATHVGRSVGVARGGAALRPGSLGRRGSRLRERRGARFDVLALRVAPRGGRPVVRSPPRPDPHRALLEPPRFVPSPVPE